MKTRHFKVMEPLATHPGAQLRFRGQWLITAGFQPGQTVQVTNPEPGKLELQVLPVGTADATFQSALAAFQQIGI
jgi:hypothetical protein